MIAPGLLALSFLGAALGAFALALALVGCPRTLSWQREPDNALGTQWATPTNSKVFNP